MRRGSRTLLLASGAALLVVLALVATFWKEGRRHLRRLRSDPAYLGLVLKEPEGSAGRSALEEYLMSVEGRKALDAHILGIAREAVATNDTWVDRAEFRDPRALRDGSGWIVTAWRMPKTPGGFRMVVIDRSGRVREYSRGD